jgi:hypothetical protein
LSLKASPIPEATKPPDAPVAMMKAANVRLVAASLFQGSIENPSNGSFVRFAGLIVDR